jgi:hypothetical protein
VNLKQDKYKKCKLLKTNNKEKISKTIRGKKDMYRTIIELMTELSAEQGKKKRIKRRKVRSQ